jgi:hypothetical protein
MAAYGTMVMFTPSGTAHECYHRSSSVALTRVMKQWEKQATNMEELCRLIDGP